MARALRLAVFASGEGTTLEAVARAIESGKLEALVALVVVDRPGAPALQRAERRGIPTVVLPLQGLSPHIWSEKLDLALSTQRVELVVLAGFLSILPEVWLRGWSGRAINLHPALLPKFGGRGLYGRRVHEAVLASGATESGATVHLVTAGVDDGPILAQRRVPILPGDTADTLRERLRPVEHELLISTVRRFASGALPLPYLGSGEGRPAEPASGRSEARS
ncbi:MAG: phosphoribosylglycinamide formyltransferase [Thermoplasmata archaeon]|nr:phosphoribosylglycinamide formyltransferase [Thermoplasmata archaeon]